MRASRTVKCIDVSARSSVPAASGPASRVARAEVVAALRARLGPPRVDAAARVLREVIDLHGGREAVRGRRVRPPA